MYYLVFASKHYLEKHQRWMGDSWSKIGEMLMTIGTDDGYVGVIYLWAHGGVATVSILLFNSHFSCFLFWNFCCFTPWCPHDTLWIPPIFSDSMTPDTCFLVFLSFPKHLKSINLSTYSVIHSHKNCEPMYWARHCNRCKMSWRLLF